MAGAAVSLPHRDREFELRCARELAPQGIDPTPLALFASRRADRCETAYGYDFPALDRDLELDGLEELADLFNYLVWRLDGIRRGLYSGMEWKVPHLQMALRGVFVVFGQLQEARG